MEKIALNNLSEYEVNRVSKIIDDLFDPRQLKNPRLSVDKELLKYQRLSLLGYFLIFFVFGLLYLSNSGLLIGVCLALAGILAVAIFKFIKNPYETFLNKVYIDIDLQAVNQFLQCDERAIQYVLLHYKLERDNFGRLYRLFWGPLFPSVQVKKMDWIIRLLENSLALLKTDPLHKSSSLADSSNR